MIIIISHPLVFSCFFCISFLLSSYLIYPFFHFPSSPFSCSLPPPSLSLLMYQGIISIREKKYATEEDREKPPCSKKLKRRHRHKKVKPSTLAPFPLPAQFVSHLYDFLSLPPTPQIYH
ncbi:hypothetical protein QBC44DRAFT_337075 [Cladorrhinum sp. PSN332]|nr:hypothetical protein QBC44DRAFT_337075 [Cladorrhinum sp. PSN332]